MSPPPALGSLGVMVNVRFVPRPPAQAILGGHAQGLALDHALDLPGAVDRIGAGDDLVGMPAGDGGDVEVLALDLVEVVAFAQALGVHRAAGIGDDRGEVLVEFDDGGPACAVDGVDLAIVVEEDGQVVHAGELVARPGAVGGLGAEDLGAHAVDVGEDVERAIVVADAGRPDALAVDVAALETESWARGPGGRCNSWPAPSSPGPWSASRRGRDSCASWCRPGNSPRRRG